MEVTMSEDLQGLLEKINRDGVEKAEAKAAEIIADAKAKAAEIVKTAKEEAERAKAESKIAADDFAARADETVKQAARDTVLKVREAITALLEGVLAKNVEKVLADETVAVQLAGEAVKDLTGRVEIAAPEKLAASLKAQLAAKGEISIVTDENIYSGFSVKIDGGRVEHAFTAEVVAEELSKRLRPELARLLK